MASKLATQSHLEQCIKRVFRLFLTAGSIYDAACGGPLVDVPNGLRHPRPTVVRSHIEPGLGSARPPFKIPPISHLRNLRALARTRSFFGKNTSFSLTRFASYCIYNQARLSPTYASHLDGLTAGSRIRGQRIYFVALPIPIPGISAASSVFESDPMRYRCSAFRQPSFMGPRRCRPADVARFFNHPSLCL